MPLVKCSYCNTDLHRHQAFLNRNTTGLWFCDKGCKDSYYTNQNTYPCAVCGNAVYAKPYRVSNGNRVTCSHACKTIMLGQLASRVIECDYCGQGFKRKGSQIRTHNFCSRGCMGMWLSENATGENSPTWLGGYEGYYGKNWEHQRRDAYKRDRGICQVCGLIDIEAGYTLDVHHKKPFRLYADYVEANQIDNLITLCHNCHRKAETYARWLYNEDRRKTQPVHPLHNHPAIIKIYRD